MLHNLDQLLASLKDNRVRVLPIDCPYIEPGAAPVQMLFAEGTEVRADYWRLIQNGKAGTSSFDHKQKYGLPAPIDAIQKLQEELQNRVVEAAKLDPETGDLLFHFAGDTKCQILNLTGYEVWEISFPDGTGEYSNYAK